MIVFEQDQDKHFFKKTWENFNILTPYLGFTDNNRSANVRLTYVLNLNNIVQIISVSMR